MLKRKLRLLLSPAAALAAVLASNTQAHASFQKEFERYNRAQSVKQIENIDRELTLRIEEQQLETQDARRTEAEREALHQVEKSKLELKKGGIKVVPMFNYHFTRNSNIFQKRNDPVPEAIHTYQPTIRASLPLFTGWRYQSSVSARYSDYLHFPHNNKTEQFYAQSVTYKANRLKIGITDSLDFFALQTEDDNEELSAARAHAMAVNVDYKLGAKTHVSGRYNHSWLSFSKTTEKIANSRSDAFGTRLGYDLSQQTEVYADFSYRFSRPPKRPETDNINSQTFTVGYIGQVTPKIAVSVDFGVENKEFAGTDDKMGVVTGAVAKYAINPATYLTLDYQRANVPVGGETPADPLNQSFGAKMTHRWDKRLSLFIGENVRLVQTGSLTTAIDPDHPAIITTKEDESYILSTGLGFQYRLLKNLDVGLDYTYERERNELRTSNKITHLAEIDATYQF